MQFVVSRQVLGGNDGNSPTQTMPPSCLENEGTQNKEPWTSETPEIHPKLLQEGELMKECNVNGSAYQTWQEPLGNQACREISKDVHRRTVGATALMA